MNGAASSRSPAALLRRGPLAARAQQPAMPGFLNAVHPPEWVALNNINETGNRRWAESSRGGRRSQACVDGSGLARREESSRRRLGRCSHVFGLFVRFT
jgi:hypothetical protein